MAIRTDYVTRGGVPVADCYVRVTDLHIGRVAGAHRLAFNAAAFVDEATAAQAHRTVDEPRGYQCAYDPDGPGPYVQAYDWLTRDVPAEGEEGEEGHVPADVGPFPGAARA